MRAILAGLTLVVAIPAAASAQWNVTLEAGIHADRLHRPEQVLRSGPGGAPSEAYTNRGQAPTIGVRATRWLTPHLGADLGVALAHNKSWEGGVACAQPSCSDARFPRKLTWFASAAPVWRAFAPDARLQLRLGAGAALVAHRGNGEPVLTRTTDFGAVILGDAGLRLGTRTRLVLGVQNYRFRSSFADAGFRYPDGHYMYPAGSVARSEWIVLPGLRINF